MRSFVAIAIAFALTLGGPAPVGSAAPPAVLVAVVAQQSPVTQLSLADLRRLFLGEAVKDTKDGAIVPINQPPGNPDRVEFDQLVLHMSPDDVGRYWVDRRIRGQGHPPRAFGPANLLQRLLIRFPNAVSYVRANEVIEGVRVLAIDGKRPQDPGYPLRR